MGICSKRAASRRICKTLLEAGTRLSWCSERANGKTSIQASGALKKIKLFTLKDMCNPWQCAQGPAKSVQFTRSASVSCLPA